MGMKNEMKSRTLEINAIFLFSYRHTILHDGVNVKENLAYYQGTNVHIIESS